MTTEMTRQPVVVLLLSGHNKATFLHTYHILLSWLLLSVAAAHKKELFDATIATTAVSADDDNKSHDDDASHDLTHQCHLFIGIAMTIGFVFMLLVDQLAGGSHDANHSSGTITTNLEQYYVIGIDVLLCVECLIITFQLC